jgi:MarR family transcriptional regulator for hemolysin
MSSSRLGFLLQEVTRLLRRRFDRIVSDTGLTRSQWQALSCLARDEGMSQSTLADILEIEPITLTRLIDRLAAKGLIERRPNPMDRRSWALHLTEAARPLLAELETHAETARAEAYAGLSSEELLRVEETLGAIKANLWPLCHAVNIEKESVNG